VWNSKGIHTHWLKQKVENRCTVLSFDGFAFKPRVLARGLDQGCPLLGLAFQFYNADLLDIPISKNGEDAVVYVDDANLLAEGDNSEESNRKIKDMMERPKGGLNWSSTHRSKYPLDKFGLTGFTRRQEKNPRKRHSTRPLSRPTILLHGKESKVLMLHKVLGMILDQELRFKEHANYALKKGTE
jgi:hypothetical protein